MSQTARQFLLCIDNDGLAASLQVRTVYAAIRDPEAEAHGRPVRADPDEVPDEVPVTSWSRKS